MKNKILAIICATLMIMGIFIYGIAEEETPEIETITIENNEDFAAVFATKNEFADIVKQFAKDYANQTIEFDGYVAYYAHHGNYKTRFDYLIYCGPYRETDFYGPNFQFRDVNYYDFNLTGEKIPDSITYGMNLHIIARVLEYEERSGLFLLDPISTEVIDK